MSEQRLCAIIPTYDNPATLAGVVNAVRPYVDEVIVVDDGSGSAARSAAATLAAQGRAVVHYRDQNGGKGAAVKDGLRIAGERGFTHALQIDADGQHSADDIPALVAASHSAPEALILGEPRFDESAPRSRLVGRKITTFWIGVECGRGVIGDGMCGFRIYPVGEAIAAAARGDRMDFDPEIAVRMVWRGVPVVNVPTRVRYPEAEEGAVSHFHLFWDNVAISKMHSVLMLTKIGRALLPWKRSQRTQRQRTRESEAPWKR